MSKVRTKFALYDGQFTRKELKVLKVKKINYIGKIKCYVLLAG